MRNSKKTMYKGLPFNIEYVDMETHAITAFQDMSAGLSIYYGLGPGFYLISYGIIELMKTSVTSEGVC